MTQIRNRNTHRSVCLHQLQSVNGIESVNTPLEGTIQHFTIGSLTVQACPCFYCFLFQHHTFCTEPQTTVNQRHNLTLYFDFYCALSFFSCITCRAGAHSRNIYKITRGGHCIILQTAVSPFNFLSHCFPFSPRSPVHGCATRLSFPSSCFPSLLAVSHSERLSCDLLYIFSIRTASYISLLFSIFIYLLYI